MLKQLGEDMVEIRTIARVRECPETLILYQYGLREGNDTVSLYGLREGNDTVSVWSQGGQ